MTKQQRNEYVYVWANKNIEHFFFHFVDYIRMDFGNNDKFSCTLKNYNSNCHKNMAHKSPMVIFWKEKIKTSKTN